MPSETEIYLLGLRDKQWIWLATVVFASTFLLASYSALKLRRKTGRPYIVSLVSIGWILQTLGLYARGLQYGGCPLANKFELVQFMVWSTIAIYIFIGPAFRVSLLGLFTSGFACVFSILSMTVSSWDSASRAAIFGDSPWIEAHAALALFSYGVFGLLSLTSAMYLMQSRSLKRKEVVGGLFPFMPSLVELVSINRRLLTMGWIILTVSLGIGYKYFALDTDSVMTIKLAATIVIWLAYGIIFILRARRIFSSKRFSWACIAVFIAALLSLSVVTRNEKREASSAESASVSNYCDPRAS